MDKQPKSMQSTSGSRPILSLNQQVRPISLTSWWAHQCISRNGEREFGFFPVKPRHYNSVREKLSPATYWSQLISALSWASCEVKKQRAGHLLAYTTKRTFVEKNSAYGRKTRNKLAHVFNSRSRRGNDKIFFRKTQRSDPLARVMQ